MFVAADMALVAVLIRVLTVPLLVRVLSLRLGNRCEGSVTDEGCRDGNTTPLS